MRTPLTTVVILCAVLLTSGCSFTIIDPGNAEDRSQESEPTETDSTDSGSTDSDSAGGVSDPLGIRTCAGESVTLDRDDTELILEGECGVLTITASRVSVTMESLAGLVIEGDQVGVVGGDINGVTSIGGASVTVTAGELAALEVSGNGSTVIADRVTELSVSGSDNTINWSSGTATGEDTGQGNRFLSP